MLILTRKVNERIVIGDDIEVSVVEIRGDQVKLGINAPQNVKVHRREVFDQIQSENRAAALSASPDLAGLAGLFSPDAPDAPVTPPRPGTTRTTGASDQDPPADAPDSSPHRPPAPDGESASGSSSGED
jgi:carbon storage regulator